MKKIICMFLGLLLIGTAFCQEVSENGKTEVEQTQSVKPKVDFLINLGLKQNAYKIMELSVQLTDFEKMDLYKSYQKTPLVPVLLNTFVGFGAGSYFIGDKVGGIIGTSLDIVIDSLFVIGTIFSITNATQKAAQDVLSNNKNNEDTGIDPLIPISIIFVAARAFEGIRANSYVKKYNKLLSDSLGIMNNFQASFTPVIDQNGKLAMNLNATIRF